MTPTHRLSVGNSRTNKDPRKQLLLLVTFHVRFFSLAADLLRALRAAGSVDPDLAALWREGEARRLATEAPVVRRWAQSGILRGTLSEQEACDVVWTMTGPDVFALFTEDRGWTPQRFSEWLYEQLRSTLFVNRKRTKR